MILKGTKEYMKTGWAVKAISGSLLAVASPGVATPRSYDDLTGQVIVYERNQNGEFNRKLN